MKKSVLMIALAALPLMSGAAELERLPRVSTKYASELEHLPLWSSHATRDESGLTQPGVGTAKLDPAAPVCSGLNQAATIACNKAQDLEASGSSLQAVRAKFLTAFLEDGLTRANLFLDALRFAHARMTPEAAQKTALEVCVAANRGCNTEVELIPPVPKIAFVNVSQNAPSKTILKD